MTRLSAILLPFLLPAAAIAANCNADNCLRALRAPTRLAEAQSFCRTFTTALVTETGTIPSYAAAACTGKVASRVSSACSCIAPATSSSLTTTTSTVSSSTPVSTTETSSTSSASTSESSTSTSESSTSTTESSTSAPTSTPTGFPQGPKICMNPELSCHNTTVVEDLCCFNAPGGQLLLTQFWDSSPSTGPVDSWTVHGLWPDHCDGTYDANCDPAREYTNITQILQSYGKTDLLAYMNTYWKDYQGNDESFWEHEWDKHGTCISTLEPSCYNGYTGQEEVVDFFDIAVSLFRGLDSYKTLANAGIIPSTTATYTFDQIQAALTAAHGFPVTIMCSGGALDEIWYHYNVLGSVQTGEFVPTSPDGSKSDCSTTVGIKYIPKYLPSPTGTTTAPTATPTVIQTPFLGKGFLQAYNSGANNGCLIGVGTWYTTGTCATYTATASGAGFTLNSSKGPCAVVGGYFLCATGQTADVFTNVAGSLGYAGSSDFYTDAVPTGQVQKKVYPATSATNTVEVSFKWQSV